MAKQKNLALIFSVVIFSLAVSYAYSAWQEPTASPPNNNVAPAASYWVSCTGGICYTSGNVGIGTTAPDEKLDVVGKIVFGDTDTKKAKLFRDSGWLHIQNLADTYDISLDGPLHIRTGGPSDTVDEVIVTSGGNVGIGTTSPAAKLDVAGSAKISGDLTVSGASTNFLAAIQKVDGSGSAIDADTLDGYHASDIFSSIHSTEVRCGNNDTCYASYPHYAGFNFIIGSKAGPSLQVSNCAGIENDNILRATCSGDKNFTGKYGSVQLTTFGANNCCQLINDGANRRFKVVCSGCSFIDAAFVHIHW
jgi:hypothetical protein